MFHVRVPTTPTLLSFVSAGGLLGVPMFFVISGYCIAHAATRSLSAPQPVAWFLKARVRRIYPPYALASLMAAALSLMLTVLIRHHVVRTSGLGALNLLHQDWRFYVGALMLTQVPLHVGVMIPVFWTLSYEVAFYAVVALFLAGAAWAKQTHRLLDALSAVTVGALIWLILVGPNCPFPWNLWPPFGLGVLAYQMLAQTKRASPRWIFFLCSVLIAVFALRHGGEDVKYGVSAGGRALFYLGFSSGLLLLFRWDDRMADWRTVRLLAGIGMFSYSLYLIHGLALGFVTQAVSRIASIEAHPWLLYLVKLALCVVAGKLFFHFCERPFLDTRQRQARREALKRLEDPVVALP